MRKDWREQWREFVDAYYWPYGIVPKLVEELAEIYELEYLDADAWLKAMKLIDWLYLQGVRIDYDGYLCFVAEPVLTVDIDSLGV